MGSTLEGGETKKKGVVAAIVDPALKHPDALHSQEPMNCANGYCMYLALPELALLGILCAVEKGCMVWIDRGVGVGPSPVTISFLSVFDETFNN